MIAILLDDYHRIAEIIGFGDVDKCKNEVQEYDKDMFNLGVSRPIDWTAVKHGRWYAEIGDEGYSVYILEEILQAGRVGEDTVIILPRSAIETP